MEHPPPPQPTPPGWYPDPWQPGGSRWWDGARWSPTTGPVGPPAGPAGPAGPAAPRRTDAAAGLEDEERWERWARLGVLVHPLLVLMLTVLATVIFRDFLDDLSDSTVRAGSGEFTTVDDERAGLLNLVYAAIPAGPVLLGVWAMRAGTVGERLGRRGEWSPGWGFAGFLIPIVHLWVPYAVLSRSLAPSTSRAPLLAWWLTQLAATYGALLVIVAASADASFAVVVIGVGALGLVSGVLGQGAVSLVLDDHRAGVAAQAATQPILPPATFPGHV